MTDAIVVLCTCPDQTSADLLCEQLLNQYQSDLEAMMRQETRQDDAPPEEVKAQA